MYYENIEYYEEDMIDASLFRITENGATEMINYEKYNQTDSKRYKYLKNIEKGREIPISIAEKFISEGLIEEKNGSEWIESPVSGMKMVHLRPYDEEVIRSPYSYKFYDLTKKGRERYDYLNRLSKEGLELTKAQLRLFRTLAHINSKYDGQPFEKPLVSKLIDDGLIVDDPKFGEFSEDRKVVETRLINGEPFPASRFKMTELGMAHWLILSGESGQGGGVGSSGVSSVLEAIKNYQDEGVDQYLDADFLLSCLDTKLIDLAEEAEPISDEFSDAYSGLGNISIVFRRKGKRSGVPKFLLGKTMFVEEIFKKRSKDLEDYHPFNRMTYDQTLQILDSDGYVSSIAFPSEYFGNASKVYVDMESGEVEAGSVQKQNIEEMMELSDIAYSVGLASYDLDPEIVVHEVPMEPTPNGLQLRVSYNDGNKSGTFITMYEFGETYEKKSNDKMTWTNTYYHPIFGEHKSTSSSDPVLESFWKGVKDGKTNPGLADKIKFILEEGWSSSYLWEHGGGNYPHHIIERGRSDFIGDKKRSEQIYPDKYDQEQKRSVTDYEGKPFFIGEASEVMRKLEKGELPELKVSEEDFWKN